MSAAQDRELARRAGQLEMEVWRDLVRAMPPDVREATGARVESVAGGIAVMTPKLPGVMSNRVFGFGFDEPVDEPALERILALYSLASPFTIQPSPWVSPVDASAWLENRGLVAHFKAAIWTREASADAGARTAVEITRIGLDGAAMFGALALRISDSPAGRAPWVAHTIGREGWHHYVGLEGGTPVAVGALFVQGGGGWLGLGGTLESHRGRGAQSALIARRIRDAREAGAAWLTSETADDLPDRPSPSFRNMARAGFRLLYRRPSHAWLP